MADHDVRIFIDMTGSVDLTVNEVWPDGDAPEEITAEAVATLMAKQSPARCLDDWGLADFVKVTVHVTRLNPEWKPGPVLPGMPRVERFLAATRAEPWT